jgi:excisionase family DNA binding protein
MEQEVPARLLLDVVEVAKILGLGRSHVYHYIMTGELRSLKLGRRRKVRVEWVREFIERQPEELVQ